MSLKKIAELPESQTCLHPEHEPPKHIVLDNGVYAHTCPSCGNVTTFAVRRPTW